jgi:hypothetical protein
MHNGRRLSYEICNQHGNKFPAKVPKERQSAKQLIHEIFAGSQIKVGGEIG